ncbi:hypothetical protein [Streptomyces sp. NBC_00094]|uniref:hypothetical protein n=1 Tax=Streptomyces sp. NBC_00094 TaxID=2903620 RepID=UPI0022589A15|nr:hypothetical protein [Streptomyces sp. NBC_00094]MCX5389053.1 hypothetical protein [Streptomyces sp. NBC_00094]
MPVAGIGTIASEPAVPVAWTAYFWTTYFADADADADEAVAHIRERGGTVGVGPVSYPPRGRAALATEPEGAGLGIREGRILSEWRVGDVLCEGTAPLVLLADQGCVTPHRRPSGADRPDPPDRLTTAARKKAREGRRAVHLRPADATGDGGLHLAGARERPRTGT